MNSFLSQILRFILLILLQILVLNKIVIFGFLCPFLYVVCILLLPITIEDWLRILISFALGVVMDFFAGTLGLHAASTVLMGASVTLFFRLFYTNKDLKPGIIPEISWLGLKNIIFFILTLVTIHHLALYFLNAFTFRSFFITLRNAFYNIIFTSICIIIYMLIFHSNRSRSS